MAEVALVTATIEHVEALRRSPAEFAALIGSGRLFADAVVPHYALLGQVTNAGAGTIIVTVHRGDRVCSCLQSPRFN